MWALSFRSEKHAHISGRCHCQNGSHKRRGNHSNIDVHLRIHRIFQMQTFAICYSHVGCLVIIFTAFAVVCGFDRYPVAPAASLLLFLFPVSRARRLWVLLGSPWLWLRLAVAFAAVLRSAARRTNATSPFARFACAARASVSGSPQPPSSSAAPSSAATATVALAAAFP